MTYKEYVESLTDTALEQEYLGLWQAIDTFDCYGISDLILHDHLVAEIERRELDG